MKFWGECLLGRDLVRKGLLWRRFWLKNGLVREGPGQGLHREVVWLGSGLFRGRPEPKRAWTAISLLRG